MSTTNTRSDSADFAYAQDLDGVWHQRPDGDTWTVSVEEPNCRTRCGQAISSVHVSEYKPDPDPEGGSTCCPCVDERD